MNASSVSFPAAILMVIVGMGWGIAMAISHDHSTMPAHAHLNLLGWVSLFLIGLFYRLHPAIDRSRLALLQVWAWIVATAVMVVGIALIHTGRAAAGEPLAGISSMVLFADMLLFGWLAVRSRNARQAASALAPAE